jgi:hypothetical protein
MSLLASRAVTSGSAHDDGVSKPPAESSVDLPATVLACAILSLLISGLAVAARFYTRGRLRKILGSEDWCILCAWLACLGFTVAVCLEVRDGVGQHIWTLAPESVGRYFKDSYVTIVFYQLSLGLTKCSVLLLYIRLLRFQFTYWAAWIMLVFVVVYHVAGMVVVFTQCIPLEALWNPNIKDAICHEPVWMWTFLIIHIASDFIVYLIPLPVVFQMRLPWRQKVGILVVLALGFL